MNEKTFLAEQFDANRAHLRSIAYRIVGSHAEADDAVQETWLRLMRSDVNAIDNLGGWLTTVVARLCLDLLRARTARREVSIERVTGPVVNNAAEQELQLADSIGVAMLVVLDTLAPNERVAFVLHDMFNLAFEDIAPIVNRSPAAARQLASRARRRVQGSPELNLDRARQLEVVSAFLAAARNGDFAALLQLLDPKAVLHADAVAVQMSAARQEQGAPTLGAETHGAAEVARIFSGRARIAQVVQVDGAAGLVFAPGGVPRVVFEFVVEACRIIEMSLIADPTNFNTLQLNFEA